MTMQQPPPAMQGELYAVPRAESTALPFTLGESLDAGMSAMRAHWPVLTAAQAIAALPSTLVALAVRYTLGEPELMSRAYVTRTIALVAVGAVIGAFFRGGIVKMSLDAARGNAPRLADLARGGRFFPAMIAFELLQLVALVLGAALLFVPYVLVWMGLALAPMWLVDRDEGLASAMRSSWRATRGERWHLFAFFLATTAVAYLGVLACCVGTFPAEALTMVATAHVYTRLAGETITPPAPRDE